MALTLTFNLPIIILLSRLNFLTSKSINFGYGFVVYIKDTDRHQFLHFKLCHPFHTKKGIPFSQALRIRRICSTDEAFRRRISDLKEWLYSRGYDRSLVDSQVNKVAPLGQEDALSGSRNRGDGANRDYLVLTFHPALSSKIYDILISLQVVLQADEEHKKLFPPLPLVSFRRAKTLRDILVRSKLSQLFTELNECTGCNRRKCQVCNFLVKRGTFSNREGTRTFDLRKGTLNCNTSSLFTSFSAKHAINNT